MLKWLLSRKTVHYVEDIGTFVLIEWFFSKRIDYEIWPDHFKKSDGRDWIIIRDITDEEMDAVIVAKSSFELFGICDLIIRNRNAENVFFEEDTNV